MINTSVDSAIGVYIFSYNRYEFIKNCIDSLKLCWNEVPITIVDDHSNDRYTIKFLEEVGKSIRVIFPEVRDSWKKTGGLHSNMNFAMNDAFENGRKLAFFIQDDMQLVRPFRYGEIERISKFFDNNENSVQLNTCFRKKQFRREDENWTYVDDDGVAYFCKDEHPSMKGMTDLGFFHVNRFLERFGKFEVGEHNNDRRALDLGMRVGYYVHPNMMWLPFPEAYRGKTKSYYLRVIEKLGSVGFYPYRYMNDKEVEALLNRNVSEIPVAEHWLTCDNVPRRPRWSFTGGLDNVRARGGGFALAAMMLRKIEKMKLGQANRLRGVSVTARRGP